MNPKFTVTAYYIFMFLLPLILYPWIADTVLLPRQLFLTAFSVLLTGFVWKALQKNAEPQKIDTVNLALVLYLLLAAVISFLNAIVVSEALYVLSKLWIIVSFSILTALLLRNNIINYTHIIVGVIIFGCVALGTALIDISTKSGKGYHLTRGIYTITGGFANKNLLSSILFLCLPFFMIGIHRNRILKIISGFALILALVILAVERTRIAMIATVVFFGIIAFFYLKDYFKQRFWWVISVISAFTALLFFTFQSFGVFGKVLGSSAITERYFSRLINANTFQKRILFWQNSLEMFWEYPLGVGLGNWQIYFPKYGLDKFDTFEIVNGTLTLQRPHNDFLWSLCETGIFGFAAFVGIFGIILWQSFRLIKTAANKQERYMFIYLFSGMVGFVMISFFDFPLERIEHLVILMLMFVLISYHYGRKFQNSVTVQINKKFVLLFLILGICFSFTIALKRFAGEKYVYKMDAAKTEGSPDEVLYFAAHIDSNYYKIDSKTIPIAWYKGVAQFSKQQYVESEICFENAYALTPYSIHVINNLASCYEINGKRQEAIAMYLKALEISPRFEEARLNLAAVYFNNKEFDKAFHTIDSCSPESKDPKYKMFLPPILKAKASLILADLNLVPGETNKPLLNLQDYSSLYSESKKNNVTFEQQIIRQLKK